MKTLSGNSKLDGCSGGKIKDLDRLIAVVRNMDESVIITDSSRKIVFVNPAAEKMLGYRSEEMVGRSAGVFFDNVPGNPPDLAARIAREASPDHKWEGVVYDRDREGNIFAVRLKLAAVPNGVNVIYVGISSVLEEIPPAAARADRPGPAGELPLIAAGLAHDFNNLLQIAVLNLEVLRRTERKLDGEDRARLRTIKDILSSCARLNRRLLTLARVSSAPHRPLELNRIVRKTVAQLRATLPASAEIRLVAARNLPAIEGDALQLQRLLVNLINNALEAMDWKGRATVTTTLAAPPSGCFVTDRSSRFLRIRVRDLGRGIPADLRERIFEPFFTTKEKSGGTGLGLSVADAIVRSHGGFMRIADTTPAGTVFEVYLPVSRDK